MNLRRSLLLAVVLALASIFAGNASAQCAGGGPFYGMGYYGGGGLGLVLVIVPVLVLMGRI